VTSQQPARLAVALTRVRIPLHEPFRISSGAVDAMESVIVELRTPAASGAGEAAAMGGTFYSSETPDSTWSVLVERLVPRLLEGGTTQLDALLELYQEVPGEPFAKAGLEGACWDVRARAAGRPLCELLGGRPRPIASGVAIGIYASVGELLERVERFVREGYQRVKIKIEPGWDVEPVSAVRRRFPGLPLMVDCNAAYTIDDLAVFEAIDRFDLMMVEQPLGRSAFADHAVLQKRLRAPICLDESAESLAALDEIVRCGSGRIINIKVQRVGGLEIARRMHDRAAAAGLPCWLGTMPELGVAAAQGLHLATRPGFVYPTDVEASSRWFVDDLVDPPIEIDPQGWIHLPAGPSTGFALAPSKLERWAVRREVFE
jgi:O-succinylbenzoate synthase